MSYNTASFLDFGMFCYVHAACFDIHTELGLGFGRTELRHALLRQPDQTEYAYMQSDKSSSITLRCCPVVFASAWRCLQFIECPAIERTPE